tara:strand:+ start:683 stop:1012 length:330 start_codon:yes stop_codon:yes gene_type:complete
LAVIRFFFLPLSQRHSSWRLTWYYKHEFKLMLKKVGFTNIRFYGENSDDPPDADCLDFCAAGDQRVGREERVKEESPSTQLRTGERGSEEVNSWKLLVLKEISMDTLFN